ncbi:Baseplate J-like protein [compost metagenome]
MYDHQTYEAILSRMLGRVSDQVDKRQGSIIYDALAPAAMELAQMYAELDINNNLSFADTATGSFLERRTAEFGISREQATFARRKGLFYGTGNVLVDIPPGSRFSIGNIDYTAISRISTGMWVLECSTPGVTGNQEYGNLLPIDYVPGLVRAELADVLVPGEDAETDEALRQRFLEAVNEQPFGGNISDYKGKMNAIDGVGGVKIFPAWNGGGTVKAVVIASDFETPSSTLVAEVQNIIDPTAGSGQGIGFAPIGHVVTVEGTSNFTVNVSASLTLATDTTLGQVQQDIEEVIDSYLLQLRQAWAGESVLNVRISQIESRILTVRGVVDVSNTQLNGISANIILSEVQIPKLGAVTLHE